jgi:hypothetical protein
MDWRSRPSHDRRREENYVEHGIDRGATNSWAFSGEPSERSERPERMRGRRVRCNAMLGGFNSARLD